MVKVALAFADPLLILPVRMYRAVSGTVSGPPVVCAGVIMNCPVFATTAEIWTEGDRGSAEQNLVADPLGR